MKDEQLEKLITAVLQKQPVPITVTKTFPVDFLLKVSIGICTGVCTCGLIYLGTIITNTLPAIRQDMALLQSKQDFMQKTMDGLSDVSKQPRFTKDDLSAELKPLEQRISTNEADDVKQSAQVTEIDNRLRSLERTVDKITAGK